LLDGVVTTVDGRVLRGERTREAIVDALLACYEEGTLRPSVTEVAARAGVSARSVHNHFEDVENLRAQVAQRQWERYAHLAEREYVEGTLAARVGAIVAQRAELFDAVTPVRRAALLSVHDSPTIARSLRRLDRVLRRQVETAFAPELRRGAGRDLLDALDALLSWDTWHRLREAQGCSTARAIRVLTASVTTLLERPTPE
jgi:TetR/AcrR family transcriptional regulator, regulator of autoinduction and epiphytic fitness